MIDIHWWMEHFSSGKKKKRIVYRDWYWSFDAILPLSPVLLNIVRMEKPPWLFIITIDSCIYMAYALNAYLCVHHLCCVVFARLNSISIQLFSVHSITMVCFDQNVFVYLFIFHLLFYFLFLLTIRFIRCFSLLSSSFVLFEMFSANCFY